MIISYPSVEIIEAFTLINICGLILILMIVGILFNNTRREIRTNFAKWIKGFPITFLFVSVYYLAFNYTFFGSLLLQQQIIIVLGVVIIPQIIGGKNYEY